MATPFWDSLEVRLMPPGFDPGGFRCKHNEITEYLCDGSAVRDQRASFSQTYVVLLAADGSLVGYFSVLADAIKLQGKERPDGVTYPSAPALKLGRMGVDLKYNGPENDCGGFILRYVIGLARDLAGQIGIRYVTLDAKSAPRLVAWYERNGFVRNKGVTTAEKILREVRRKISMEEPLEYVSMRYDVLLEGELGSRPPA
jgi:hypothetical protein